MVLWIVLGYIGAAVGLYSYIVAMQPEEADEAAAPSLPLRLERQSDGGFRQAA